MRLMTRFFNNFRTTKFTLIDGENFKFLPADTRIDFIGNKYEHSHIIMVGKNPKILNCYREYPFYNSINFFLVSKITSKSPDDAFCIFFGNKLIERGLDFSFYSNDKFRDVDNIINQNKCIIINQDKWLSFDPKTNLNKNSFDNIKYFHHSFN